SVERIRAERVSHFVRGHTRPVLDRTAVAEAHETSPKPQPYRSFEIAVALSLIGLAVELVRVFVVFMGSSGSSLRRDAGNASLSGDDDRACDDRADDRDTNREPHVPGNPLDLAADEVADALQSFAEPCERLPQRSGRGVVLIATSRENVKCLA